MTGTFTLRVKAVIVNTSPPGGPWTEYDADLGFVSTADADLVATLQANASNLVGNGTGSGGWQDYQLQFSLDDTYIILDGDTDHPYTLATLPAGFTPLMATLTANNVSGFSGGVQTPGVFEVVPVAVACSPDFIPGGFAEPGPGWEGEYFKVGSPSPIPFMTIDEIVPYLWAVGNGVDTYKSLPNRGILSPVPPSPGTLPDSELHADMQSAPSVYVSDATNVGLDGPYTPMTVPVSVGTLLSAQVHAYASGTAFQLETSSGDRGSVETGANGVYTLPYDLPIDLDTICTNGAGVFVGAGGGHTVVLQNLFVTGTYVHLPASTWMLQFDAETQSASIIQPDYPDVQDETLDYTFDESSDFATFLANGVGIVATAMYGQFIFMTGLSVSGTYETVASPTVQVDQLVAEILIDYDMARAGGLPAGQVYEPLITIAVTPNGPVGPSSTPLWPTITLNPYVTTGVPLSSLALQPADDAWSAPTGETGIPHSSVCYPLETAVEDVAARLQDPNMVHWTQAEITRYLVESLRTYNAYTQAYRNRDTFSGSVGAPFYDLPTVIPALRGYTVTDRDLVTDVEYALMEPPTPTVWTGTSMFTLADVTGAIQRRRDQFLRETGAVVTRAVLVVTPDANGRFTLPSNVVTVRRMAWIAANGVVTPLQRDDEWGLTHYDVAWPIPVNPTEQWPTTYSVGVTPPLVVQFGPPPSSSGSIEILAIVLGDAVDPTVPTLLRVPDDWAWVVKWGALADLLGIQGTAFDPRRSAHAQARWTLGIQLATQASVLLAAYLDGAVTQTYSISDTDQYQPDWETTPGIPTKVLTTAQNLVGLAPPPNGTSTYVVTVDVVANMPVPTNPTDCVNLGIDDSVLDAIYDYAQYLAMFKEGPGVSDQALPLYQRFAEVCGVTTALDQAAVPTRGPLFQQTAQDVRVHARRLPPETTESN